MGAVASEEMDSYTVAFESVKEVFVGSPFDDKNTLSSANALMTRSFVTEFEFKCGRHCTRSRKKKEALNERIAVFVGYVPRGDWRVLANAALVAEIDKHLA